jgi:hypothetical protein
MLGSFQILQSMADPPMPLQNRVTPEGDIIATPARGTMMGNRGGAFHTPEQKLGPRRWRTKAWICCVLKFKGRHRAVMQPNRYTELFFLDEATALAAGHRPCFECRRQDALRFAEAWRMGHGLQMRPRAAEMDAVLHPQRVAKEEGHSTGLRGVAGLPDGVFVRGWHAAHLVVRGNLLAWTLEGYVPIGSPPHVEVEIITPPAIVAALSAGYRPMLHPTAARALESDAQHGMEGEVA